MAAPAALLRGAAAEQNWIEALAGETTEDTAVTA